MGMGTLQRKDLPFRDVSRIIEIKTGLLLLLAGFGGKDVGAVDYGACTLCPRACGVDRRTGQLGFCRMPGQMRVAKAMRQFWEEPALAGPGGSGAIFFSGCTLGCLYCQNEEISAGGLGREWTSRDLRRAMEDLIAQGAENIDLVKHTHFLP